MARHSQARARISCSQLAIARSSGNQGLEGQILLGKGFALMQPAMRHQQEEFMQKEASKRTELAIDADAGLACLRRALAIAEAGGQCVLLCCPCGGVWTPACVLPCTHGRRLTQQRMRMQAPATQSPVSRRTYSRDACVAALLVPRAAIADPRRWLSYSGSSRREDIFPCHRGYLFCCSRAADACVRDGCCSGCAPLC